MIKNFKKAKFGNIKRLLKNALQIRLIFSSIFHKIKIKLLIPYIVLSFVLIMTAIFINNYFIPIYFNYVKEQKEINILKAKIKVKMKIDAEKTAIFNIIDSYNSGLTKKTDIKLANLIFNISKKYKMNPALILAVIRVESSFYNNSFSNMGAVGLMQVTPITALYFIKKYNIKTKIAGDLYYLSYIPASNLLNPMLNVQLGSLYLLSLIYRFGSLKLALLAYNAGPTFIANSIKNNGIKYNGAKLETVSYSNSGFKDAPYLSLANINKRFELKNADNRQSGGYSINSLSNYFYYDDVIKYFKTYNKKIFKNPKHIFIFDIKNKNIK
ncbi:MAG: lytic transglycosylase domain-containing protein [bacterium]